MLQLSSSKFQFVDQIRDDVSAQFYSRSPLVLFLSCGLQRHSKQVSFLNSQTQSCLFFQWYNLGTPIAPCKVAITPRKRSFQIEYRNTEASHPVVKENHHPLNKAREYPWVVVIREGKKVWPLIWPLDLHLNLETVSSPPAVPPIKDFQPCNYYTMAMRKTQVKVPGSPKA